MTNIRTIRIDSPSDVATAMADMTADYIEKGHTVVWFLSGGSAIEVAVQAREMIGSLDSDQLHVCLVDERYGEPGHQASNWQRLIMDGFEFTETRPYPVLASHTDIENVAEDYNDVVAKQLGSGSMTIGLFGVGEDGHTAGLLPGNPVMDSKQYVDEYKADDFKRITLSPKAIQKLTNVLVYAAGKKKWPAITNILSGGDAAEVPARIFNDMESVYLYTDYEGDLK